MKDCTDITIIIDRSGSMLSLIDDAIGGHNTFLAAQKAIPGDAVYSRYQFDHEYQRDCEAVPLAEATELNRLNFVPRGNTALYDAVGRAIVETGERLAALAENDRPDKVLVVIITDGQENWSKEFNGDQVKAMIKTQRDEFNWAFLFLSADESAFQQAQIMGIGLSSVAHVPKTGAGMQTAYASLTRATTSYRGGGSGTF